MTLADLVAAGLVIPPTITGPIPLPTVPTVHSPDVGALLSDLRDEERA